MNRLTGLNGKKFDKEYLLYEIEFHRNAIQAVKTIIIPNIQNKEAGKFIQIILPGIFNASGGDKKGSR